MTNIEKVEKIWCDSTEGVFSRLRNRDYTITEEEKIVLMEFAEELNKKIFSETIKSKEIVLAMEILVLLYEYDEEEWTSILGRKFYGKMISY